MNIDIFKTKKRLLLTIISILMLFLITVISTPACSATFRGKVIDADTKKPIEGAVVVASWNEERATLTDGGTRFKDVKETLTDKNGEWVIEGPQGRRRGNFISLVSFITGIFIMRPPEFIIFRPGYCSWPQGFHIESCKGKIKFELNSEGRYKVGEGGTIGLPVLMNRMDRMKNLPGPINGREKQNEFIRLINEESRYLGLDEY